MSFRIREKDLKRFKGVGYHDWCFTTSSEAVGYREVPTYQLNRDPKSGKFEFVPTGHTWKRQAYLPCTPKPKPKSEVNANLSGIRHQARSRWDKVKARGRNKSERLSSRLALRTGNYDSIPQNLNLDSVKV